MRLTWWGAVVVLAMVGMAAPRALADKPRYVPAKAYHVLPETTSEESGYFSLCEGSDGNVYVGAAKYGHDAYLVEFDPRTERQRVVIDTNRVCGLTATGYAAQAKLHTRNFVGPSGTIYVGSKQGYRLDKSDTAEYPGGYVMTYDPRTGAAANLGMPFPKQGVIDVVADEGRDKLYVVTCEDQHWMLGTCKGGPYRELGPMLTPYATTLVDPAGRAHALTKDFQLATYDPATDKVTTRPIECDGRPFVRPDDNAIPTWVSSADHTKAYLILMDDPTLVEIDLAGDASPVKATRLGRMVQGKHPDCRCGLSLSPDGHVYALVRVDNDTGFGTGYLHHLARLDTKSHAIEDLGVLAVSNPDYFPFDQKPPHSHGFHRLPDGTLTPLHHHMALCVAHDGTIYATILYPFTLLKIDAFKLPPAPQTKATESLDRSLAACDRAEQLLPQISRLAGVVAQRHVNGGLIGFPFETQALAQELWGRSGNLMHVGFTRPWKTDRSEAERAQDVAVVGYDRPPDAGDVDALRRLKQRGAYLIGISPRQDRAIADVTSLCDAWLDTGDVHGRDATLGNAVTGWTLMAEVVGALTQEGKMPPLFKSFALPDGQAWCARFLGKQQFDDEHRVAPQPAGQLGSAFICQARYHLRRLHDTQLPAIEQATIDLRGEVAAGRKVVIAWQGHMPTAYIGRFGDAWAVAAECHPFLSSQVDHYRKTTPDGALVLSLGYHGLDPLEASVWRDKRQRVIHACGDHPDPAWRNYASLQAHIDLGFAFGDACVTIDGYPARFGAPSGILQLALYDAIASGI